ncbi:DMT family transporter [Aggregatilineales bacterium SYSU G02658]
MPTLSWPHVALVVALVGFTFGAPTLRLTQMNGMPTEVMIFIRLTLATLVLTPFVWVRHGHELRTLTRRDIGRTLIAGVFMTCHLLFVVESLRHTTVVFNQVLVNTGPVWVALLEVFALRVRFAPQVWWGLGIALAGSGVLLLYSAAQGTAIGGPNMLLGNVMAVISAGLAAVYIVIGRSTRQKVSFLPYIWLLFGVGALVALMVVIVRGLPVTGYSSAAYFWIVMVTIFPTLIGHASFNFALVGVSATLAAVSGQVGVLTTAILAYLIFHEVPTLGTVVGGAIIVLGVVVVSTTRSQPAANSQQLAWHQRLSLRPKYSSRPGSIKN